jgi:hypothetical protein
MGKFKTFVEAKSEYEHVLPDGSGTVKIYDAGDKIGDRYTAVFSGGEWDKSAKPGFKNMLGFSSNPEHPQGISQWSEGQDGKHLGKLIKFSDLPSELRSHVIRRATKE